jgi:hypothetical protein
VQQQTEFIVSYQMAFSTGKMVAKEQYKEFLTKNLFQI